MPFFSDDVLEDVRVGNDIVGVVSSYVRLRQKGANYFGLCPFHNEKSPSFSVHADKQIFHCFGCGAGGNVITFIMRVENFGFADAVRFLADRINYALPEGDAGQADRAAMRDALYEMNKQAAMFYFERLMSGEGEEARNYLDRRGVSQAIRRKFGLGFSPGGHGVLYRFLKEKGYDDEIVKLSGLAAVNKRGGFSDKFFNRLMFPIFDAQGRVVAFGGRVMGQGEPKYLNSPETLVFSKGRHLYNINNARKSKSGEIILVEGYMDALALVQAGFDNVAATLGTAFGAEHCKLLHRYARGKTAVLLFDGDEAGEKAAVRALPILRQNGVPARVLRLSGAKDPDEFFRSADTDEQGHEAFLRALSGAENDVLFRIGSVKKRYNLNEPDQKVKFLSEAADVLAGLESAVERDVYISGLSAETGVSVDAVRREVEKRVRAAGGGESVVVAREYVNKPEAGADVPKMVLEAGRHVLYAMASHPDAALYTRVKNAVNSEELILPAYIRLFGEIVKTREQGRAVNAAEIVGRFETVEEQQCVSSVFSAVFSYEDDDKLIRALNDQVKILKLETLSRAIEAEEDILKMRELALKRAEIQRNMAKSYI